MKSPEPHSLLPSLTPTSPCSESSQKQDHKPQRQDFVWPHKRRKPKQRCHRQNGGIGSQTPVSVQPTPFKSSLTCCSSILFSWHAPGTMLGVLAFFRGVGGGGFIYPKTKLSPSFPPFPSHFPSFPSSFFLSLSLFVSISPSTTTFNCCYNIIK